jgi:threonine/homoserine/homoserine lactone efflux protein
MIRRCLIRRLWNCLAVLQFLAVICAFERQAHAYVDPGSGYVFLQILGSMFAGAIFYFRQRWRRVLRLAPRTNAGGNSSDREE